MRNFRTTSYEPASLFKRTEAERNDQQLSWVRPDRKFFAAGACHILAWAFLERYSNAGFHPVGLRYSSSPWSNHVYVTDGTRSFDFFGWSVEEELLKASSVDGPVEQIDLTDLTLDEFCAAHNSRLPDQFAGDVRARAQAYLESFPAP